MRYAVTLDRSENVIRREIAHYDDGSTDSMDKSADHARKVVIHRARDQVDGVLTSPECLQKSRGRFVHHP
jgi:hypothetical protein